ncbi:MAG TPA: ABC transporter permease [Actinotalea sp.]|nr:ABC transporter permease [Actinotalea sp.]
MSTTVLTPGTSTAGELSDRSGPFTGTGALLRLAARRDRVLVPVWWGVFMLIAYGSAAATVGLYPDEASRRVIAETVNANLSLVAIYGPVADPTSIGQISMFKTTAFGAALVGLLSIILVVRHTRAEEESGRTELVGAGVTGRWAPLAAALVAVGATNVVLALLTALGLAGAGLDLSGGLSFGLAWAVTGLAFAGVAAVTAQLAATARAATGLASAVLATAYVVRAVADTSPGGDLVWLRWLSPVGWAQEVHAFSQPRWAVGLLGLTVAAGLAVVAFGLLERRDLGSGLLSERPGRVTAGRGLTGAYGLALRLERSTFLGWAFGYALLGAMLGTLVSNLEGFMTGAASEFFAVLGGAEGLTEAFLGVELAMIGVFTSAFAVEAVLRLRGEETARRADLLMVTPLGRVRWAASHLTTALGGSVVLLGLVALTAGASTSSALGDTAWFGRIAGAAAVQLPAVAVLAGLTMLAIGLAPRWASALSWGALVAFLLLGELGPLFELPSWLLDLSPFSHTPMLPGGDFSLGPVLGLSAVAVGLVAAGLAAFRRRDLE